MPNQELVQAPKLHWSATKKGDTLRLAISLNNHKSFVFISHNNNSKKPMSTARIGSDPAVRRSLKKFLTRFHPGDNLTLKWL
jgi:hypothetical protein